MKDSFYVGVEREGSNLTDLLIERDISGTTDAYGNIPIYGTDITTGVFLSAMISSPTYLAYQPTIVTKQWYLKCSINNNEYIPYVGTVTGKAFFIKSSYWTLI